MGQGAIYGWESLPEYIAAQQYGRCLGRIFRSLSPRTRRRAVSPLTRAALLIVHGIVGFHADLPPDHRMAPEEREVFRRAALQGIEDSREALGRIARAKRVSRADLLVAGELLERIEASVRAAEAPPAWL